MSSSEVQTKRTWLGCKRTFMAKLQSLLLKHEVVCSIALCGILQIFSCHSNLDLARETGRSLFHIYIYLFLLVIIHTCISSFLSLVFYFNVCMFVSRLNIAWLLYPIIFCWNRYRTGTTWRSGRDCPTSCYNVFI